MLRFAAKQVLSGAQNNRRGGFFPSILNSQLSILNSNGTGNPSPTGSEPAVDYADGKFLSVLQIPICKIPTILNSQLSILNSNGTGDPSPTKP